jgi:hypothetical protein
VILGHVVGLVTHGNTLRSSPRGRSGATTGAHDAWQPYDGSSLLISRLCPMARTRKSDFKTNVPCEKPSLSNSVCA